AASTCKTTSSIAVAQDIGGRIKGAHIDRYTGAGLAAARKAESFSDLGLIFMAVSQGGGGPGPPCVFKKAELKTFFVGRPPGELLLCGRVGRRPPPPPSPLSPQRPPPPP